MTPQELDIFLRTPTPHELLYREGKLLVSLDKEIEMDGEIPRLRTSKQPQITTLDGNKSSRYRPNPAHAHPWVEFAYMYSGRCVQTINSHPVTLEQGQVLLLDRDAVHKLPVLGDDDILLNIFLWKDYLTVGFFNRISEKNIVSQFLINAITEGITHNNYILFDARQSRRLPLFIQEFFCEMYDPGESSFDILKNLFILILTELIRFYSESRDVKLPQKNHVLSILRYIERNYRKITLTDTAEAFNLNPQYLSNLLKKTTGSSFQALVTNQRMLAACQLLTNSSLAITEIASQVGCENTTFFYRKFQSIYGCSPSEYRNKP